MVIKKVPPKAVVVLSFEDQHRIVQVVALFADVARRAGGRPSSALRGYGRQARRSLSANNRKASEEKGTGLKQKQKNKVRKICGPCFLFQTLYPETGNCKLKNPLKWFPPMPYVASVDAAPPVCF